MALKKKLQKIILVINILSQTIIRFLIYFQKIKIKFPVKNVIGSLLSLQNYNAFDIQVFEDLKPLSTCLTVFNGFCDTGTHVCKVHVTQVDGSAPTSEPYFIQSNNAHKKKRPHILVHLKSQGLLQRISRLSGHFLKALVMWTTGFINIQEHISS